MNLPENSCAPSIDRLTAQETALLERLLQLYFFDSSYWSREEICADGRYDGPTAADLAGYVDSPHCQAYLLRVEGQVAGFALTELVEDGDGDSRTWELADMFVLPRYRGMGVASAVVAGLVFASAHPWLLAIFKDDAKAQRYWASAFKRLPFASVRAHADPALPQFTMYIVNEQPQAEAGNGSS